MLCTMSENENDKSQEFAKQFIDIWQRQFAEVIKNPDAVMEMINPSNMEQWQTYGKNNESASKNPVNTDISSNGDDELSRLKRRISECERRIADLESQLDERSREPSKLTEKA